MCTQGEEDRKRTQEAINTVLVHLASAAVGLMSDPRLAIRQQGLDDLGKDGTFVFFVDPLGGGYARECFSR